MGDTLIGGDAICFGGGGSPVPPRQARAAVRRNLSIDKPAAAGPASDARREAIKTASFAWSASSASRHLADSMGSVSSARGEIATKASARPRPQMSGCVADSMAWFDGFTLRKRLLSLGPTILATTVQDGPTAGCGTRPWRPACRTPHARAVATGQRRSQALRLQLKRIEPRRAMKPEPWRAMLPAEATEETWETPCRTNHRSAHTSRPRAGVTCTTGSTRARVG